MGLSIKEGNDVAERRIGRETDQLFSDNEAGERDGKAGR
jgi:hypothetical protein